MDVESLRRRTPGCANRTHLNNAGAALLSETTLEAMQGMLRLEAELGGYEAEDAARQAIAGTYDSLARLVGGTAEEIALFDNSTHAWNAAFYSVPLGPGDRILTAADEYGSAVLAYWQVAQRTGAELVVVPNDENGQVDLDALADLIDERTKIIGLTWIPTSGGLVNPAAAVGAIARAHDVLFLLDATQAVGQLPIDVAALGCDLLTGTGRKFLRGPRGTGFLWAGPRAVERLDPNVVEIGSATWDGGTDFRWRPGAGRFETWEKSYVNVVGLGSAVDQALELGLEAVAERARGLGSLLRDGLDALPGVTTHDLGAERCAIVTASIAGVSAQEAKDRLAEDRIAVSTTVPEHNQFDTVLRGVHPLLRFSPHYFTTEDEIDRTLARIRRIAA
ncbi:Selenocysteine lyase/Cysteine desulfurase [Rathayibacter oskolensis]|uniref:Selenocysteine lyase/Cysteine desulfurase n=1 Tax=Rathayibacter oskolensis TaxID=1891671 RepID=A0A1X7NXT5_9MICO|nr:aminotransferase class V-fold PLP-dependent enzyme [Rathayibacter oskolensis]SMH42759.1 Selenocysteine lyase/Cysteine desulfurase [Rathayibacter oskolensis]